MGRRLRVAAWNTARHAPDAKLDHLGHLSPDVAVLPELGRLPMPAPAGVSSFVDFGTPGELGIGVAAWGDWTVSRADVPAIEGEVIGAVEVEGPARFNLVAVWAYLSGTPRPKVSPVVEALDAPQGEAEEPTHWHSSGNDYMVDHIFTPDSWPIVSVVVENTGPWKAWSDHAPLVADLIIP